MTFKLMGTAGQKKSVLCKRTSVIRILICVLLVSLLTAGCSGTNSEETTAPASPAAESTMAESKPDVTKEETTPTTTKEAETTAEDPASESTPAGKPEETQVPATAPETEPATDPAEVPFKVQQTFADTRFSHYRWDFHIWEKTPSVLPKSADVLPDTLGTAKGKTDDVRNGSSYYIAALDLTVEIPEGYYLYRVDGLFRDADGNPVRMEFVDEYILALRDLSEEELVREIYAYQEDYAEYPCPHWVLWNFKVFHKDYLPVEQLYDSQIDMTEELRQAGDYLVSTGTTRGWFKDNIWEGYYADFNCPEINKLMEEAFGSDAVDWEALYQQHEKEYDWPIRIAADQWYTDDFINQVLAASEGSGISYYYLQPDYINGDYTSHQLLLFYNDGRMTWCWERFADASILNDAWWTDFMFAMQELKTNPEKYAYPEIEVLFADGTEEEGYYAPLPETETSEEWKEMKAEQAWQREGWVQDASADITARAFVYAWLKAMGQETPLEDIVIYLKQSQNDARFFLAFTMDRGEGCELTPAYKGVDYLSLGDLDFARNYVEQYVK